MTYGVSGSATYAVAIPEIYGMLSVLPDNTANQITAQQVRDVVAGLWDQLTGLSSSVTTIASASISYTNTELSTVEVGGLTINSTFSNITIQDLFDQMLYPYIAPIISLSSNPSVIEYGNTQDVVLSWSIQAKKNDIVSSNIYRPLQAAQSVSTPTSFGSASGSFGSNQLVTNTINTFTFSVNDLDTFIIPNTGGNNIITVTVSYSLSRFWGTISSSSPLATISSSTFSYSDINSLSSDLLSGYIQSRTITSNNDYVFFIWPSNVVDLVQFPPKVYVNGFANNDWVKTRNGVVFTNQWGYTASYDVWRFNYIQASNTLTYVII
jgi:hypothetical protein